MTDYEKLTNVFVETFGITSEMTKGLAYQEIPEWDSVGHMTLVAALEDAFEIMLDTDDIIDLSSFERSIEILEKYEVKFN
jgi:acyl carrier protein